LKRTHYISYTLILFLPPLGYWCIHGIKKPCAEGFYGNTAGASSHTCSGPSPAGFYTTWAATTPTPCGGPSKYCPLSSNKPLTVPPGYYSVGGTADTRGSIVACESGNYCVDGIKRKCPAGTYGASTGLSTSLCDGLCSEGHYCLVGSISQTPCDAGRFGATQGLKTAACSGECLAGYFCPSASTSSKQNKCGSDAVYCPRGTASRLTVSAGYYGDGGDHETHFMQTKCRQGENFYQKCVSTTV
jgi:hypothetical protein